MDKASKRAASVEEVRRLISSGKSQISACLSAQVSPTNYRRWAERLDVGGVAALADKPKSGRPKKI